MRLKVCSKNIQQREDIRVLSTTMKYKKKTTIHCSICLKNLLPFSLLVLNLFIFGNIAHADTTKDIVWKRLETKHTIIHYQAFKDLAKFCSKVKSHPDHWGLAAILRSQSRYQTIIDMVCQKADNLFEKVQKILSMKKKMYKVHIQLFANKARMNEAYEYIYRKECNIRAWYRVRNNTIYLNANDLSERILAHEMAHAIADNYLLVRPPRQTAEIIARYVDKNLTRSAR
jgi:hypothetical protein